MILMRETQSKNSAPSRIYKACFFCAVLYYFFIPYFFFAESENNTSWVLASEEFSFDGSYVPDAFARTASKDIPLFILQNVASDSVHAISEGEAQARSLDDLLEARLALFLELSKENAARDSLVLRYNTKKSLKKALESADLKIAAIEKRIDENLSEAKKISETKETEAKDGKKNVTGESISLYKNDASAFFSPPKECRGMYDSYGYKKAIADAGIHGLIKGSINVYGQYAAVSAELLIFPGALSGGIATDVGLLSDTISIAENLSRVLIPKIVNSAPVSLRFNVSPENAVVSIDGVVVSHKDKNVIINSGIHNVVIEATGYETAEFPYAFIDHQSFSVSANLKKDVKGIVRIYISPSLAGVLHTNDADSTAMSAPGPYGRQYADLQVDGHAVLGRIADDSGHAYFYIPERLVADGGEVNISGSQYDVDANIEKYRRRMYTAYSFFILSLPFSFYTYGRFVDCRNAAHMGDIDYEKADMWQKRSWAAIGVSVGLGAAFVYQLVRYLRAADNVLPVTADEVNDKK